jgi:hypothetical protein
MGSSCRTFREEPLAKPSNNRPKPPPTRVPETPPVAPAQAHAQRGSRLAIDVPLGSPGTPAYGGTRRFCMSGSAPRNGTRGEAAGTNWRVGDYSG